jgi:SAM-dependent methyltransferase
MDRLKDIVSFIEYDFNRNVIIEPEKRLPKLLESVLDVIKTYNPGVIVKAGLGSGRVLYNLAKNSDAYIVVVEPSLANMREFTNRHAGDAVIERIRFINGEFNSFPVDYNAADMIVCIDYLDFLESGKVVDEFTRALQFDGILFMACVVLEDDDLEGRYDDFMRSAFPLHNDYYLREDLKTFMDLNDLKFVKGTIDRHSTDLAAMVDYFAAFRTDGGENPLLQIEAHREEYRELYKLDGNTISEPYYISVYTRVKPGKK